MLIDTKRELERFRRNVVRKARQELIRQGKDSSKALNRSLHSKLKISKNSFSLDFFMEEYGNYQDKGVSGIKKKYDTKFSYSTKRPPAEPFEEWIKNKGIQPRDRKTGRFMSRKTLSYILREHVYKNGIKPSLFFTKPFTEEFSKLPEELLTKYGLDLDRFIDFTLKETYTK